jgi:hypothetical protein
MISGPGSPAIETARLLLPEQYLASEAIKKTIKITYLFLALEPGIYTRLKGSS